MKIQHRMGAVCVASFMLIYALFYVFIILVQAEKLAAGFLALGLKKGDRVGIWGPNVEEWILTQFATAKAGLILVQYVWTSVPCFNEII